jgi:V-type H+-transporting ATPase subunit G
MSNTQAGIAQLLEAEAKAQEVVNQARKEKASKLTQARDDAAREVQAMRTQAEKDYQAHLATHGAGKGDYNDKLERESKVEIEKVVGTITQKREELADMLLQAVTTTTV